MLNAKKHKRNNCGKSFLLLFMFLFSCVLQVSVTLKCAELMHLGTSSKVTKGLADELPDTPENPEKNNCDCFEEDSENESIKVLNFELLNCFSFISKIDLISQSQNTYSWNSIVHVLKGSIYLSIRNIRI